MNIKKITFIGIILLMMQSCFYGPIVPTGDDAEQSIKIINYLYENYPLIQNKTKYPLYGRPRVNITEITIYNIEDKQQQNSIIDILKNGKQIHNWKPIKILFFKKENLKINNNITTRGDEKLLRSYEIN